MSSPPSACLFVYKRVLEDASLLLVLLVVFGAQEEGSVIHMLDRVVTVINSIVQVCCTLGKCFYILVVRFFICVHLELRRSRSGY